MSVDARFFIRDEMLSIGDVQKDEKVRRFGPMYVKKVDSNRISHKVSSQQPRVEEVSDSEDDDIGEESSSEDESDSHVSAEESDTEVDRENILLK